MFKKVTPDVGFGMKTIIPVELGLKARPFENTLLFGRHWSPEKSSADGERLLVLKNECNGPLRIKPEVSGDKGVISRLHVSCKSCNLNLILKPTSYRFDPLTRDRLNMYIANWIRETTLAMYVDLDTLADEVSTSFFKNDSGVTPHQIGTLTLVIDGHRGNNTCLGLVPFPELAVQAMAVDDYLLSQFIQTTSQSSKAIGERAMELNRLTRLSRSKR